MFPLALVLAGCLVVASCGARLTEEQRAAGIGGSGGSGGGTGSGSTGLTGSAGTAGTAGSATGTAGTGTAGTTGIGTTGTPAGGNGGATDIGITANQITVATVSDVSGVQPGLFKSSWQATQAFAAYLNSQGGIYGRALKVLPIDTKTNAGGNKAAVLEACDKAFALVGSQSAFDDGGAAAVDRCKIPDLTAITTNPQRIQAKYTFPAYPNRPDWFIIGTANFMKEKAQADGNPDAIKASAALWLNASVTRVNALQKKKAYESVGFEFQYTAEPQLFENNYTPYVLAMKNNDPPIEYVQMVSDYQSIVRLLQAMRQQNWYPKYMDWDSVVYSPGFITLGGTAIRHSKFFINTAMFEEKASVPELQLYEQWLQRVAPGAKPDYFGLYAWSAARMFATVATSAGPKLTREGLIAEVKKLNSWTGNGLHAAHDIGNKKPSNCFMYGEVRDNRFVRHAPDRGYICNKGALLHIPLD